MIQLLVWIPLEERLERMCDGTALLFKLLWNIKFSSRGQSCFILWASRYCTVRPHQRENRNSVHCKLATLVFTAKLHSYCPFLCCTSHTSEGRRTTSPPFRHADISTKTHLYSSFGNWIAVQTFLRRMVFFEYFSDSAVLRYSLLKKLRVSLQYCTQLAVSKYLIHPMNHHTSPP